jgi:metallophosphoesterase superfamily enzyme
VWIVGNHDAEGPRRLPGDVVAAVRIADLELVHAPADGARYGEVAGHLHPCAKVKGRVGKVRRRCFITDGDRIVLPAFGAYAGGLNVLDAAFGRLFVREPLAIALADRRAHAVSWGLLRPD